MSTPAGDGALVVPSVPQSVAQVRRYAVQACLARGWTGDCDTVALLVSEVATNALVYGTGSVRVTVAGDGPRLRIAVTDDSPDRPALRDAPDDAEGGRGLALVDALADAWGVDPHDPGKSVWFELSA